LAVIAQTFDVKFNGFLNEFQNLFASFSRGNTTREIRNMSPKASFAFFDNDGIFHISHLLQASLFKNTVQRSGRHVNARLSRHCHGSGFRSMFELTMASSRSRQIPTIIFE
jgi:hypothetical protein